MGTCYYLNLLLLRNTGGVYASLCRELRAGMLYGVSRRWKDCSSYSEGKIRKTGTTLLYSPVTTWWLRFAEPVSKLQFSCAVQKCGRSSESHKPSNSPKLKLTYFGTDNCKSSNLQPSSFKKCESSHFSQIAVVLNFWCKLVNLCSFFLCSDFCFGLFVLACLFVCFCFSSCSVKLCAITLEFS